MKYIPSSTILIATISGIILAFLLPFLVKDSEPKYVNTPTNDTICLEDSFSAKDFVLELHLQGIKYPDVVLRQACWETGFFTSKIWREKNNPFGLYHTIDSIHGEYILFNDWRSAITYYKEWQDKRYKGGDYYDFLIKVGYAQDSNYVHSVKGIDLSNLKNIK